MTQKDAIKEMGRWERQALKSTPCGLLNSKQAAKFLGIHPVTMSRWIHSGRIKPTPQNVSPMPRFSIHDLKMFAGAR